MGAGYHGGFGNTNGEQKHKENIKTVEQINNNVNDNTLPQLGTIETNTKAMVNIYPLTNGKFGEKGKNCQVIYTENVLKESENFYKLLTIGSTEKKLSNDHGVITTLHDGTLITYRKITSTPNSPAVEITVSGSPNIKNQKIHFEEIKK